MHKDKATSELQRINAPKLIVDIVNGETKAPDSLEWQIEEPQTYFYLMEHETDSVPYEDIAIPLWETNGDKLVAYVPLEKPIVYQHYYEDPLDRYKILGNQISSAVFHILSWEYVEGEEKMESILKWAQMLEYPDLEQLKNDLDYAKSLDYDSYLEWKNNTFKNHN